MSDSRLSLVELQMKEKAEECVAMRRILYRLDQEYQILEGEWITKSRQIEKES